MPRSRRDIVSDLAVRRQRRRMLGALLHWTLMLLLALAGAGAYFVWPTPWKHSQEVSGGYVFETRTHRLNGRVERRFGDTWQTIQPATR